ncbi:hypothetical protein CYMTET_51627, partial [Cymbomonas tetramitiformis]
MMRFSGEHRNTVDMAVKGRSNCDLMRGLRWTLEEKRGVLNSLYKDVLLSELVVEDEDSDEPAHYIPDGLVAKLAHSEAGKAHTIPDVTKCPKGFCSYDEVQGEHVLLEDELEAQIDKAKDCRAPVLHGISLSIPGFTHVGVVGRTGAGKTTLASALLRLLEPSAGQIIIDGVDILRIGLKDLRMRIAVIPQEPVLFSGTVRSNLDYLSEHTSDDMRQALRQVRMDAALEPQGGLAAEVKEGGANLSVGQRQLLCMARALLRKSTVLVMDEATASVDPETDSSIQEVIQTQLHQCTILCIAHRLHSIIYYDRVLVLQQGHVHEYGAPSKLLGLQ